MDTILVSEGDQSTLSKLEEVMDETGYTVVAMSSAQDVLDRAEEIAPGLFILGVDLPDMTGIDLCRRLRTVSQFSETPIILLGKKALPENTAKALDAGGDDYIKKPFVPRELVARVRAHLRRSQQTASSIDNDMPLVTILPGTLQVIIGDRSVQLTRMEYNLMYYLSHNANQWHSISNLLEHVWQYPGGVGHAALVRNHVRNLRRKLEEDPDHPSIIHSRHGRGYMVKANIQFGR